MAPVHEGVRGSCLDARVMAVHRAERLKGYKRSHGIHIQRFCPHRQCVVVSDHDEDERYCQWVQIRHTFIGAQDWVVQANPNIHPKGTIGRCGRPRPRCFLVGKCCARVTREAWC